MAYKKRVIPNHSVKTHNRTVHTKNGTKSVTIRFHKRKNPK